MAPIPPVKFELDHPRESQLHPGSRAPSWFARHAISVRLSVEGITRSRALSVGRWRGSSVRLLEQGKLDARASAFRGDEGCEGDDTNFQPRTSPGSLASSAARNNTDQRSRTRREAGGGTHVHKVRTSRPIVRELARAHRSATLIDALRVGKDRAQAEDDRAANPIGTIAGWSRPARGEGRSHGHGHGRQQTATRRRVAPDAAPDTTSASPVTRASSSLYLGPAAAGRHEGQRGRVSHDARAPYELRLRIQVPWTDRLPSGVKPRSLPSPMRPPVPRTEPPAPDSPPSRALRLFEAPWGRAVPEMRRTRHATRTETRHDPQRRLEGLDQPQPLNALLPILDAHRPPRSGGISAGTLPCLEARPRGPRRTQPRARHSAPRAGAGSREAARRTREDEQAPEHPLVRDRRHARDPGCYGGGAAVGAATPVIDRLAREGLRRPPATPSRPVPRRVRPFTGRLPVRTGLTSPSSPATRSRRTRRMS